LFGAFLTTAGPEPRAVQSIRGEPGSAANRQAFACPYYLAIPQDLHDPQIKRVGFRVSKNTRAARRPFAWATRGPESLSKFSKNIRTVPTYLVYDRIAPLLRVSPAEPNLGDLAAFRPSGAQRREEQQVGLVLGQHDAAPRQRPDLPANATFFFSRSGSGTRSCRGRFHT